MGRMRWWWRREKDGEERMKKMGGLKRRGRGGKFEIVREKRRKITCEEGRSKWKSKEVKRERQAEEGKRREVE